LTEATQLTHGDGEDEYYCDAEFSPDGGQLVLCAYPGADSNGVSIMDLESWSVTPLTSLRFSLEPSWSPTGDEMVFVSAPVDSGVNCFAIWTLRVRDRKLRQLTFPSNCRTRGQYPRYSPDGEHIVWTHDKQLWIMGRDGANARPLTKTPAKER
jgi:Tol biopolymer transport system component